MSDLLDAYWAAPPVARNVATAVFIATLGVYFGPLPAAWVYWQPEHLVMIPPQIWRLATNFLLTGPKLGIVLDPYFLFSYLRQLEVGSVKFSRREDVVWYLVTVSGIILILNTISGINAPFCLQALILSVAYTATQDQRGQSAGFFFFTIPAQLIPYAMMFSTLVMDGPDRLFLQVIGLFAAHIHDFLYRLWPEFGGGRNWLATPAFVSRLIQTTARVEQRAFGTAQYAAAPGGASGRTTGASAGSGPLPDSWKTRGAGHRLG
ncbi:hypothetical protein PspLS_06861 [Pyricularia sp. CBS 133598]|nr:hypothetical protein PspLS_06861 [Pyricularia sp. CBS 133598]